MMIGRKLTAVLVVGLLLAFSSTALASGPPDVVLAEAPTDLGDGNWEYVYDVLGNPSGGTHIVNFGLSGFNASQIVNQCPGGWSGTLHQKWDWAAGHSPASWERDCYGSYANCNPYGSGCTDPWILHGQSWAIDNPWHDPGDYNAVFPYGSKKSSYSFPWFIYGGVVAGDGQSLLFTAKNQNRGPAGLILTFRIVHPNPAATINWSNHSFYGSDVGSGTVTGPATAGDCDLDSDVDWLDYQALEVGFGMTTGATWGDGDFDGDGDVDWADYQALEASFGKGTSGVGALGGNPVAEPAAALLFGVGLTQILVRRRRK